MKVTLAKYGWLTLLSLVTVMLSVSSVLAQEDAAADIGSVGSGLAAGALLFGLLAVLIVGAVINAQESADESDNDQNS